MFMPSIIRDGERRTIATSRTDRVEITSADGQPSIEAKPLKWPDILANDPQHAPSMRICESCPNFSVRRDGCPACSLFPGGCARSAKFKNAIIKRGWPEGCPQRASTLQRSSETV